MLIEESIIIKKILNKEKNKFILNIGSSDSNYYKNIQPHIWKNIIEPLKQKNNFLNIDTKPFDGVDIVSDCRNLENIKDNSVDVVIFTSIIEHLLNPHKAINEINRVLKDDGFLVASIPGVYPYHPDPLDNNIRLPEKSDWESFLKEKWQITDFYKTKPEKAPDGYEFKDLIFATIVKAKKSLNLKNLKVDAFLLSYKREENLNIVIGGLKKQSFIKNIYVFHNNPSTKKVKGVINIFSEKNFKCIVRHSIAQMAETEYVFFIDDDLELLTDLSDRFIDGIKYSPDSIVGLFGNDVDRTVPEQKLYFSGGNYTQNSLFLRFVDIIVGRLHIIKRRYLIESFNFFNTNFFSIDEYAVKDDIILNLSAQLKTKTPGLIIPAKKGEDYRNLPDPFAVCNMRNHFLIRSLIIKEFLDYGWIPNANKGQFLVKNIERGGDVLNNEKRVKRIKNLLKTNDILEIEKEYNVLKNRKLLKDIEIYNIAGLLKNSNKISDAEKCYHLVLNNDNSSKKKLSGLSNYHLGQIYKDLGKTSEARKHFTNCLKIIPDHLKAKELLIKIK